MSFDMTLSYEHADFVLAYDKGMARLKSKRKMTEGKLLFGDR